MKRSIFTLLSLTFTVVLWSQIVTSNPVFVTKDYTGTIEIIYDATKGTAGLKDYVGTDGVFAHVGVITNLSTSNSDWKHAPAWGDNSEKYRLTSLGNNLWKLTIAPNMATYFNLAQGVVVKKIAMVFRNGLRTKEGKDVGNSDIFLTVYDAGLNLTFTSPTTNQSIASGTSLNFTMSSSLESNLELTMNGASLKTATASTTLSHTQVFNNTGDYLLVASATLNNTTIFDTLRVCVPEPVINQARPAGTIAGINYIDNSTVTLVLHAPTKSNVFVIGEFNDWTQLNAYQLKRDGEHWWITLTGLSSNQIYGFQYLVDGTLRVSDPYTEMILDPWHDKWINQNFIIYPNLKAYPVGKTEGIVSTFQINRPVYNWEVPSFTMPHKENMVIYELLLRDFTTEKTLEAAIGKLDYLKKLGINVIELMPIQEFDGNNSWGYNPNHFFAPDKAYGNRDMYKRFIDECHKRGMAVLLDIVVNHATGTHPFAKLFWNSTNNETAANNPWFNVVATHPYNVFHDFNHSYSGTKEHFKRMIQYWITEFNIDGYRLDLTKGLTQNLSNEFTASNYDQSRIDNLIEYYDAAKAVKSDVMFILEHFCNHDEELVLANRGMYLWRNANDAFSQAAMGFQSNSDFGALNSTPRRWVGYAESHDEERNFFKAKEFGAGIVKTDSIYRISRVPLNIAFTVLTPGPKMIWQFGELGYDYSINSFGGRTSEKPPAWNLLNLPHRNAAYEASSKIVTLRTSFPRAFTEGTYSMQIGVNDWNAGRRIALTHNDLNMVALGNFNASSTITAFPNFPKTGSWYNLQTGEIFYVGFANSPISLKAGELLILTDRRIDFTNAVHVPTDANKVTVYPSITKSKVHITGPYAVKNATLYNIKGAVVESEFSGNQIDLSKLNNGLYLLQVETANGKSTHKVIKE